MRRLSIGLWTLALLPLAMLPGLRMAQAQAFEADIYFPEAVDVGAPPVFATQGDEVVGSRVVDLPSIDDLDVHLVANPNQLAAREDCVLLIDAAVNDVPVGTISVRAGDLAVDTFLRPAEPVLPVDGSYTFSLTVAETLPEGCGSITLPLRATVWHLEVEDPAGNARPRGTIGGPYTMDEGSVLPMAAQGVDPEGEEVTFSWDFDNDGEFDDGVGANAVLDAALIDGPAVQTIRLRLSDAGGAHRELETTVTVNNVAPLFDPEVVPERTAVMNVLYTFVPRIIEPCSLDVLSFTLLHKPDGMTLGENGTLEWTPTQEQIDIVHLVRLKVQDDEGDSSMLNFDIRVLADPNIPTVFAGEDRTVDPGCIELVCEGTDPRGRPLLYHWTVQNVLGGDPVVFTDPDQPVTTAVVSTPGSYTFTCVATEDVPEAEVPLTSPADSMIVMVNNLPPIADPGFTTFGKTRQRITLDGRRSIDPNGDALRYRWTQVSGDQVHISGFTNVITSFYPTVTDIYCFTLTATDTSALDSEPAEICVVVNEAGDADRCERDQECGAANARCLPVAGEDFKRCEPFKEPDYNPVASAGEDSMALVGDTVQLKGMRSYDPDGEQPFLEQYIWSPCSPLAEATVLNGQGTMIPNFVPLEPGRYCYSLVVRDGSGHSSMPDEVEVLVETPDNRAPRAEAGPGIAVHVGEQVVLDGSGSRDPDGDTLTFAWEQLRGPHVVLSDPTAMQASFCASVPGIYQFRLTVHDGVMEGRRDEVWVTVTSPCNEAPIAKAGADFSVLTDDGDDETLADRAVLDGRQTYDPDPAQGLDQLMDGLKWQWVQVGGLPVDLQLPFTRMPWFRTNKWGIYTFRLFALDAWPEGNDPRHPLEPPDCWSAAWSLPDDVTVVVDDLPGEGNAVPRADAGPDLVDCLLGEECYLDGRGSRDADGDELRFVWQQLYGEPLALADKDTATPHFTANELGEWGFQLTVSDGYIDSLPDVTRVKVRPNDNYPPVCRAGFDSTVVPGTPVVLNGCGSLDQNGDALTYTWSQTDGPAAADFVQGQGADACKAFFTAPSVQQDTGFTFTLVTNDGRVDCEPDSVVITVSPRCACDPDAPPVDCACPNGMVGKRQCLPDCSAMSECSECRLPCACQPGEERNCYCDAESQGTQTCKEDCTGWTACTDCEAPPPPPGPKGDGDDDGGCALARPGTGALPLGHATLLGLLLAAAGLAVLRRR